MAHTTVAQDLAQAEQDLAAIAQAIAHLYDMPIADAETQRAQQHQREQLDAQLDRARARVLELRLVHIAQAHAEVTAALEQAREHLAAAEVALRHAQREATAASAQVAELEAQERTLRSQRDEWRRALAVL